MKKYNAGIIGATGMVGQRFALLLENHPQFNVTALAASPRSAGKPYGEVVKDRWMMNSPVPEKFKNIIIEDASDIASVAKKVDFVFCAVDMKKEEIAALEEAYAKAEIPVISNNSAHRNTADVPMLIPEINPAHAKVVEFQRKRLGTKRGFIAVKSNCSIQSYVPALHPLMKFGVKEAVACTYQAISGAGKTFETWGEMVDNVIPFIGGEEEKSEQEPLKIWGEIADGKIINAKSPVITTQCIRVPVSDGHLAAVFVRFENKPTKAEILDLWNNYDCGIKLPSSPEKFLTYFEEENFPQTKLHRD
jgi:aspartate-semialdehyde dehydrogenase